MSIYNALFRSLLKTLSKPIYAKTIIKSVEHGSKEISAYFKETKTRISYVTDEADYVIEKVEQINIYNANYNENSNIIQGSHNVIQENISMTININISTKLLDELKHKNDHIKELSDEILNVVNNSNNYEGITESIKSLNRAATETCNDIQLILRASTNYETLKKVVST